MLNTSDFVFNQRTKVMSARLPELNIGNSFPRQLEVRSEHTGRVVKFTYDNDAAERNEWWDGEMAEYVPVGDANVKKLVITAC